MSSEKKLIVKYWKNTNAMYQAKLEEKNQVSTLSQEEAKKLITSPIWKNTETRQIADNKRPMIEKTYVLELVS